MPKPPILKKIEWKDIFETAISYKAWLANSESDSNRAKMEDSKAKLILNKPLEGYLKNLDSEINILVIAEDWCGDVVRHVPVLQKIVEVNVKMNAKFLSRDAYPEVFSRYLTNGGEAIPKFIFFNRDFVECGNWGPMPSFCRDIIARGKACDNVPSAREKVAEFYKIDCNCRIVMEELLHLIDIVCTKSH